MSVIKTLKVTEANRFSYTGEFLDVEPALGYTLLAEYREAAAQLHAAKARAFSIEEKIKTLMGGSENLRVDGEIKVSWTWQTLVKFDKAGLKQEFPELVAKYTTDVPDGKRVFNAKGVVGVE